VPRRGGDDRRGQRRRGAARPGRRRVVPRLPLPRGRRRRRPRLRRRWWPPGSRWPSGGVRHCGASRIVADHFHLVRLANPAVTDVRRRVSWDSHAAAAERPTRPGRRPPALAPGVGAAVPAPAREDVERPDGRRPEHRDPHRLDRQGRAPRATAHRPRGVGSATTSRTGCTGSTAGAHNPGCPSSSASPARLRRGGPRGKPSSAGTPTTATGPHTPTLRHRLLTVPGRILRHARSLTLRLPAGHTAITGALQRVRALPPPG